MYRSQYTTPKSKTPRSRSVGLPPKSVAEKQVKYVSEVTIQLSTNRSRETSASKLLGSERSPQQEVNNSSNVTPEKDTSQDTLSSSLWSQVTKKPVKGTPRTSTPEKHVSPRGRQRNISRFQNETLLTNEQMRKENEERKPFNETMATDGVNSKHQFLNKEKQVSPPSEFSTLSSRRDNSLKNHWYMDIMQRLEDLSWNYQTMEVEYSFLEKLMAEQKEDLKKAKSWNNSLRNQQRAKIVH